MGQIVEYIEHPFAKGNLTSTGVQWSAEVTSTKDAYEDVESVTIEPPDRGKIIELEFGITWAQKASGANDKSVGRIQARNKDGTWVTIMTEVTNAAAGTVYEEKTFSGRFLPATNINSIPFQVKVQVKSNGTTDNGVGKTKNSSYVKVIYSAS